VTAMSYEQRRLSFFSVQGYEHERITVRAVVTVAEYFRLIEKGGGDLTRGLRRLIAAETRNSTDPAAAELPPMTQERPPFAYEPPPVVVVSSARFRCGCRSCECHSIGPTRICRKCGGNLHEGRPRFRTP
jgi:hypothetical protein